MTNSCDAYRFLEVMGVASPDIEIELEMEYFCILASKPQ